MFRSAHSYSFLRVSRGGSRRAAIRATLFSLIVVFVSLPTLGQQVHILPRTLPPKSDSAGDAANQSHISVFRARADLVLVPVTVTDQLGRLVTGLDKDSFQVYEGKEKQAIQTVSSEDSPVSLGILFDTSGSMIDKIERAREAVGELLATANPQDDVFLITFADTAELAANFTTSVEDIQSQLLSRQPQGSTALLDAIYFGISEMRQAKYARKALLIISDGGDNHSRYRERDIRSAVREADVLVYAIGIYDRDITTMEEQMGPALLSEVSEETGGQMFTVDNPKDMAGIAAKISLELRNQYVLGYQPVSPKYDGKWHKIKVKLSLPKGLPRCDLHAKHGYYAPSE
jgi:Ca-activated chloride channel family protein